MKKILFVLLLAGPLGLFAQNNPARRLPNPNASFDKALVLYGELSGRTVLRHPGLASTPVALNNPSTNRAEILQSIEAALAAKQIVVLPAGEKFVLIGAKAHQAQLMASSTNLPASTTKLLPKGSIQLQAASLAQTLELYASLKGKKLDRSDLPPATMLVTLVQTNELTKEECLYAFETLIRWQGWELISVGADTVKAVPLAREPERQSAK